MTDTITQTEFANYYQRVYGEMREKTSEFIKEALAKADSGKKILFIVNSNNRYRELAAEIEAQSDNQNTSNIFIKTVSNTSSSDISNLMQASEGFDVVLYDYVSLLPQNWPNDLSSETVR